MAITPRCGPRLKRIAGSIFATPSARLRRRLFTEGPLPPRSTTSAMPKGSFRGLLRSGGSRDDWYAAHELLSNLYARNGYCRKAAGEIKAKWAARPGSAAPESERTLEFLLEKLPDMAVVSRGAATDRYTTEGGDVFAPVTINGHSASFTLDTDSNMSVISALEAKRLGMTIQTTEVPFTGVTGSSAAGARMALANRLVVGKTEIRNVPFMVLGDDREPFSEYPLGERGILGVPVMLAVRTFRWNRNRELSTGFSAGKTDTQSANLCFDGTEPLVRLDVQTHALQFVLDTGSELSEMWPKFAAQFQSMLRDGKKSTQELTGFTGSSDVEALVAPVLQFKLGDFPMELHDAPVLLKPTGTASQRHYGRVGIDLLNQASEVTLNLKGLTIRLK